MNSTFRNFFEALKGADAGTKVVIAVASAAMIGTMAVAGMLAKDEHYVPAFVDVSSMDMPDVTKALADANIPMEVRSGDSGSAVYVPRSYKEEAGYAVYSAGALRSQVKGILYGSSAGPGTFAGSAERLQYTRAKEMDEFESILETKEFVKRAEGFIYESESNGFSRDRTASATLAITTPNGIELTNIQKQAISSAFGHAFGLEPEEFSITDQNGRTIHGGGGDEVGAFDDRVFELQRDYNHFEEQRINRKLADILGPNKALVSITSEFDTTQSTLVTQEALEPVETSSKEYLVETPTGAAGNPDGGGVTGSSGNVIDPTAFGVDSAAVVSASTGAGGANAKTEEKEATYFVPTTSKTEIHNQPVLKRLSVSLSLDSSLEADKALYEDQVKGMVGFDEDRDYFVSAVVPFVIPELPEEGEAGEVPAEGGGFDMGMLLERGVELATALAFIFLLLKGLKSAKGSASTEEAGEQVLTAGGVTVTRDGEPVEAEIDPETLARAQVENLVTNNPERVAQILSNWVIEDRSAVKS